MNILMAIETMKQLAELFLSAKFHVLRDIFFEFVFDFKNSENIKK